MRVERLRLSGFRNLEDTVFEPDEGVNVICGDNAQGKTNLLEALWLFCGAKSFRGAKDSELLKFGGEGFELEMRFQSQGREQEAGIRLAAGQKAAARNGIKLARAAQLGEAFCAVVFSPDHLELVKREPRHRRALLDGSLCQAYPKYGKILESYEKILKQRAFLLRDLHEQGHVPALLSLLDVWDESLIEYGGYITWMRARYVEKLAGYAAQAYDGICGGKETFGAAYAASCTQEGTLLGAHTPRGEVTALLRGAVEQSRAQDIRHGSTQTGPHRDELIIQVDGRPARLYGSQGQQRSCVLALKLAECHILTESHGEPPVVLLDDVMSELDEGRRRYLLGDLRDRQIFITCCDKESAGELENGRLFTVKNGALR